jgi:alcohol dehydrogenase
MGRVISHELEILGSHGMAAHRFGAVFGMMTNGRLQPSKLIQRRIPLTESIEALVGMDRFASSGVTIISTDE